MSFSTIDLSQIPAPDIIETLDYEAVLADMLADLKSRDTTFNALVESDPAYKVLEVAAYREMLLRSRINSAAKAVMLPYATGSDLDNLGVLFRTARHELTHEDNTKVPPVPAVMEADNDYRRRIYLAPEGLTNAGTEGSYIYHTLKSTSSIKDASAKSPNEGNVLITVLGRNNDGLVSSELLATITSYLSQPDIRQLTDLVTVQSADIIGYTINATLYIQAGPGTTLVKQTAERAVTEYVQHKHKVGVTVPISGIYRALQQEGVSRVEMHSPADDIVPTDEQAAYCTAVNLTEVII